MLDNKFTGFENPEMEQKKPEVLGALNLGPDADKGVIIEAEFNLYRNQKATGGDLADALTVNFQTYASVMEYLTGISLDEREKLYEARIKGGAFNESGENAA
ncbi:hypothetical protein L0Y49_00105 [bacterium]|nr:hypothetical protein [bacterium]